MKNIIRRWLIMSGSENAAPMALESTAIKISLIALNSHASRYNLFIENLLCNGAMKKMVNWKNAVKY